MNSPSIEKCIVYAGISQSPKLKYLIAGWENVDGMPDAAFTYGDEKSAIQIFPESHRP